MGHTISYITWSDEQMTDLINMCKDEVLRQLVKEGVLDTGEADSRIQDWHVQVKHPKWISKAWAWLRRDLKESSVFVIILKQLNIKELEVKKDESEEKTR